MFNKQQRHFLSTLKTISTDQAPTVSNEGLISDILDNVKELFKYRPANHAELTKKAFLVADDKIKSVGKLKKLLKKCFLNDRWLDRHELVSGMVSSKGIANRLCFGDKFNTRNALDQVEQDASDLYKQMQTILTAVRAQHDFVKKEHDRLLRLVGPSLPSQEEVEEEEEAGDGDFAGLIDRRGYDAINQFISDFERDGQYARLSAEHYFASDPKRHPRFGGNWSKNGKLTSDSPKLPDEIPALTRAQIKIAANIVSKWLDDRLHIRFKEDYHCGIDTDGSPFIDTDNSIFWCCLEDTRAGQKWASLVGQEALEQQWRPEDGLDDNLQIAMIGLVEWIGKSIKGRLDSE